MVIGGCMPNSLIDYPGKVSYLVFVLGCNMNCFYCHNHQLINPSEASVIYPESLILDDIQKRVGFIDAVVISGGEPTLQEDLALFIRKIKSMGLLVKLDTNGSRPDVIRQLLDENLLDYIAMDLKAPLEKYYAVCGKSINTELIKNSIEIIVSSGCPHQFRTTCVPQISTDDIKKIRDLIKGSSEYVTQKYVIPERLKVQ